MRKIGPTCSDQWRRLLRPQLCITGERVRSFSLFSDFKASFIKSCLSAQRRLRRCGTSKYRDAWPVKHVSSLVFFREAVQSVSPVILRLLSLNPAAFREPWAWDTLCNYCCFLFVSWPRSGAAAEPFLRNNKKGSRYSILHVFDGSMRRNSRLCVLQRPRRCRTSTC